jgi:hypothetical protein
MAGNYGVHLSVGQKGWVSESYYAGPNTTGIARPDFADSGFRSDDQWHEVVVRAELPAGSGLGSIQTFYDGVQTLNDTLGSASFDLSFSAIQFGAPFANPGVTTRTVRLDRVGCTFGE